MKNTMRTLAGALVLFCVSLSLSAHDFKTPEAAIDSYIKAVSTGSGMHIEMAFLPEAKIQYYDPSDKFFEYTRDNFAKAVDTGQQWDAEIKITNLQVTGNAANAKVDFTWGENGEHGYVDYLNLIYSDDSWHISNKVAQYIKRK